MNETNAIATTEQPAKERRLTMMQDRFVRFYTTVGLPSFGNGTLSCRKAGYAGDENTLAATASRLLRNGKIQAVVEENKRLAEEADGINVDWWRREQLKVYKMSIEAGDRVAANQAIKSLGQHLGAYAEDNRERADFLQILLR